MDLQDDMGLTYMFITHSLSVVKHISDEIVVMYLGQCVEQASSDELFINPLHPYTKALLSAIPEPDIEMRNKPIQVIKGEVTSPINPAPGCRFAARCEYVMDICKQQTPDFVNQGNNHFAACWKLESKSAAESV
jgi:oligopeptide/dipeptide ABC transporter ATP-binding protein